MARNGIWFVVIPIAGCVAACSSPCSAPSSGPASSTTSSPADAAQLDEAGTSADAAMDGAPLAAVDASSATGTAEARARLGSDTAQLGFARAIRGDDDVEVVLTAQPFGCEAGPSPSGPYLSFAIPRGPGGTFFAGATIGVEGFLLIGDGGSEVVPPHLATASLSLAGSRAQGEFRFESATASASGHFGATLCPVEVDDASTGLDEQPPMLDMDAPKGPFTIVYGGTTLRLASAVAMSDGDGKEEHLGTILLTFTKPPSLGGITLGSSVVLEMTVDPAGATGVEQKALVTTRQPVLARLGGKGDMSHARGRGLPMPAWGGGGAGWMRLSKVSYAEGGTIEGELVVDLAAHSGPNARAKGGGRFTARVQE